MGFGELHVRLWWQVGVGGGTFISTLIAKQWS